MGRRRNKEKAMAPAGWSQLPHDLLVEILTHLTDLHATLQFGRVCSSWRSAAVQQRRRLAPPPPMLMTLDNAEPSGDLRLLSLHGQKGATLHGLPGLVQPRPPKEEVVGYSNGWLFVSTTSQEDEQLMARLHFHFLRRGLRIALPPFTPSFNASHFTGIKVCRILATSSPIYRHCTVIAVFRTLDEDQLRRRYVLAFCRPWRDSEWTTTHKFVNRADEAYDSVDMVVHKRRLYVIDCEGVTEAYDLGLERRKKEDVLTCWRRVAGVADTGHPAAACHRLVESDGELLQVTMCPSPGGRGFRVFKLDAAAGRWSRVESLGGRALLLSCHRAQSISVEGLSSSGFKANCIYDSTHPTESGMNIYSMEDDTTQWLNFPIEGPPPGSTCWVRPSAW